MRITRRVFLQTLGEAGASAAITFGLRADQPDSPRPVLLSIRRDRVIGQMPANFTGLSYEAAQLGNPNFFSPSNADLISLVKRLGARGILRIGGNTSEFTTWTPNGPPGGDTVHGSVGPDALGGGMRTGNKTEKIAITRKAVENLAAFVQSTGWQLMYGLNLGTGTPEQTAAEAKAVAAAAGKNLFAFQIGNEADLYPHNGLRPKDWGYDDFLAEWRKFAAAIRKAAPGAPLAGPDVANATDWIVPFSRDEKGEIVELTGHYYAEGPPTDPSMTLDRLLHPNPKLLKEIPVILEASRQGGIPFRMTECNSCYKGGKSGVSDTFGSALWAGDLMLELAQAGYVGVNLHGGGEGIYTPISGSRQTGFTGRPIYYGMLLAGQFAGFHFVECVFDTQGVNATAYAAQKEQQLIAAVFNKDEHADLRVQLDAGPSLRGGRLWRLIAPDLESTSRVTFAGSTVSSNADWAPKTQDVLAVVNERLTFTLRAGTAGLVFLD